VFNFSVLFGALAVFALTILLWPVAAAVRWHYGHQLNLDPAMRRGRILIRIVCLMNLAFATGWIILAIRSNDLGTFTSPLDPLLRLIQLVGWLGVGGALVACYVAFLSWAEVKR